MSDSENYIQMEVLVMIMEELCRDGRNEVTFKDADVFSPLIDL